VAGQVLNANVTIAPSTGVNFIGTFNLQINTTSQAVSTTVLGVDEVTQVPVVLPAGPFIQVSGVGLSLTVAGTAADRIATWEAQNAPAVSRAAATLAEIWESNRFTFTTLSVAVRVIRALVAPGS